MNRRLVAFLRLYLPVALLIVLGAYFFLDSQRKVELAEIRADESLSATLGAMAIDRRTQVVLRHLYQLAAHSGIEQLPGRGAMPNLAQMKKSFINLIEAEPVFDRVRWIDDNGQEVIRVDLKEGKALVIPDEQLTAKADSPFFSESMRQPPDQVYISPMDRKVGPDAAAAPYQPVLRLALPMQDAQGNRRGILVIDYLGSEVFSYLESFPVPAAERLMLVNSDGYFLRLPLGAEASAFNANDPNAMLAKRFPESWARIRREGSGQFVDRDGLWTFQMVYPRRADIATGVPATHLPVGGNGNHYWLVMTHLSSAQLATLAGKGRADIYPFVALLLALFAAGAYALIRAAVRERRAERRFKVYFERATVGMAMALPDKRWIAVNPAICRMLGYSAEALLTKRWNEVTHPDDLALSEAEFNRALAGEVDGYELKKRYVRADGEALDVLISAQFVRNRDGSPDCCLLVVEDISQRLRAERQSQQSIEVLRRFIDYLPGVAYIKDEHGRVLVANRQFGLLLGLKSEALLGKTTEEIFPGEVGKRFVADDRRILASGRAEQFEESYGGRIYQTIKFPIRHDDDPPELGGITIDITERKATEQMLGLQTRRSTALLTLAQISLELDEQAFMGFVLAIAEELTGSEIAFIYFVNAAEESIELAACSAESEVGTGQGTTDRRCSLDAAGTWADAVRLKHPVLVNEGVAGQQPGCWLAECAPPGKLLSVPVIDGAAVRMLIAGANKSEAYTETDVETLQLLGNQAWRIIRQRRVEKALLIANQVVNASPVVCFRWAASEGWPVVFVSENVVRWGYSPDELKAGKPVFSDLIHPDDQARIADDVRDKTAAGCSEYEQEYRIVTRENKAVWVVDRTIVRRGGDGAALYYDGVLTDITERKKQQLALAENLAEQKKLNKLLEEAHNQLLQSEKMASIGQLAAGVAHELNNPIGFVHSNLGTLEGYLRDLMEIIDAYEALAGTVTDNPHYGKIALLKDERDFAYIREDIGQLLLESKDGLARVRKIVQDLKSFSHVGEQDWQWADLHQGLDSTLNIVWNDLKYKCKVVKEYGDLPPVYCMISQLNQVFMNLLVNAGHAIEQQGVITIRTRRRGENELCVEISDTGQGIAPELLSRIFEPFFTTKPVGKGTGLGLSLSYSIVNKHHGHIEVDSVPGQGTTFRVILPINQGTAPASATPEAIA